MAISSLVIAVFDLDSWNLAPKTGSTQGIRIWRKKFRFLKITVHFWQIKFLKIEKKWSIREKKMTSTVLKIIGWNLVSRLILGRELWISSLIWRFWIVNASNLGIKSQKSKKAKNRPFQRPFWGICCKNSPKLISNSDSAIWN